MKEKIPLLSSKLLILYEEGTKPDQIRFIIEQKGIYVEEVVPLASNAFYVPIDYTEDSEIDNLIAEVKTMKIHRIFKSAWYRNNPLNLRASTGRINCIGMVDSTVLNFISLLHGKTIRINCPSNRDNELRTLFYQKAVEINSREKLDCKFDFDNYDVALHVGTFHRLPTWFRGKQWDEKWYVIAYADRPLTPIIGVTGRHLLESRSELK